MTAWMPEGDRKFNSESKNWRNYQASADTDLMKNLTSNTFELLHPLYNRSHFLIWPRTCQCVRHHFKALGESALTKALLGVRSCADCFRNTQWPPRTWRRCSCRRPQFIKNPRRKRLKICPELRSFWATEFKSKHLNSKSCSRPLSNIVFKYRFEL